jgi:hypothetical protein
MDGYTGQYAEKITIDEYNRQKDEYTQKALKELQSQMKEQEYKKRSHKRTNSNDYKKENNKRLFEIDVDDFNQYDTSDELINDSDNDNSNDNDNEIAIENKEFYDNKNKEYNQSVNFIIKHSIETMKNDNAEGYAKGHGSSTSNLVKEKRKCDIKHKSLISANENTAGMNDGITSAVLAQHEYDNKVITNLKQANKSLRNEIEDLDKKLHYMKLDLSNLQVEYNDLREAFNTIKNNCEQQRKLLNDAKDLEHSNNIYIITLKILVAILMFIIAIILI